MGLSDDRIKVLAFEINRLEAKASALAKKAKKKRQLLLKEMERRGATGLEYEGPQLAELGDEEYERPRELNLIRIAYSQAERVVYLADKARKLLPLSILRRVTRTEIDKAKLEKLVLAGEITPAQAAKFSEVKKNAPYLTITVK